LCGALSFSATAHAQSTDTAFAEALYREGRALMDAKRYDEACAKFGESQRLDPATGTLLNLAACNEARGKTATAWLQYNDALLAARRDQREDRVTFARERIAALEPKLSRLTVVVEAGAEVEGLEVRLDGARLGAASRGVPAPVDPGKHRLEARAPGKKAWSLEIELGAEADQKTVRVPVLDDAPVTEVPPQPDTPPTVAPALPPPTHDVVTERPVPASVYIMGGATVVLAIGAGVTGAMYFDRKATYNELNEDPQASDAAREDARDKAQLWGVTNGVLTAGAVLGAVATGYLYFSRPEVTRKARISPWVGPGSAGIAIEARAF
jgi:hypothetical protein